MKVKLSAAAGEGGQASRTPRDPVDLLLALGTALQSIGANIGRSQRWVRLELTMTQLKVLFVIADSGGLLNKVLADRLGIARSAVTPLVDALVRHGLVRREIDTADRRAVWVRPTLRGQALHQKLLQIRRPVVQKVWAAVPTADREAVQRSLAVLLRSAEDVRHNEGISG